jgi:hypothetical protein
MIVDCEYLIMCKQAEELQDWYRSDEKYVKEGDWWSCSCESCINNLNNINVVDWYDRICILKTDISRYMSDVKGAVGLSENGGFGAFWIKEKSDMESADSNLEEYAFIWIPRQDQIQDMLWDDYSECAGCMLLYFYKYAESECDVRLTEQFEKMWLSFLMEKKYSKQWDFDKREWVSI